MIRLILVCLCVATWHTADCQTSTLKIIKQSSNRMTAEICVHHNYTIDCGWEMKLEFSGPLQHFHMEGAISKTRGGLLKSETQPFVVVSNGERNKIQTHEACHRFYVHFKSPVTANATYSRICSEGNWTDLLESNASNDCLTSKANITAAPQQCNPSTCPREELSLTPLSYWRGGVRGRICVSRGNPLTCIFDIELTFSASIKNLEVPGMRVNPNSGTGFSYSLTLVRLESIRANKTQCYSFVAYHAPRTEKVNSTARYSDKCIIIPETTIAPTRTFKPKTTTERMMKSTRQRPTENADFNGTFQFIPLATWKSGQSGWIRIHPNFPLTCRNIVELSISPPVLSLEVHKMTILHENHTDGESLFTLRSGIEDKSYNMDRFWILVRHNNRKELTNITSVNVSECNVITSEMTTETTSEVTTETTSEMTTETTSTTPSTTESSSTTPQTTRPPFTNYVESLKKSMTFYRNQRALNLSDDPLRRLYPDLIATHDGRDLSGGLYDSADYVKFNFPMAATTTTLLWGFLQWTDAYKEAGQLEAMYELMKHCLDYLIKCWDNDKQVLITQIGTRNTRPDHQPLKWSELSNVRRVNYYTNNATGQASDLAGEMAAAMAAGYLVFRRKDSAYAAELLRTAQQLYTFAEKHRGFYSTSSFEADYHYKSTGYYDELCWGAAWLLKATGNESYLSHIKEAERKLTIPPFFSWDRKELGFYLLMHDYWKTKEEKKTYSEKVKSFFRQSDTFTKCGLQILSGTANLKYAANNALIALMAADSGIEIDPEPYRTLAEKQIKYMLGANDYRYSFQVGFGQNYPEEPIYLGANCTDKSIVCEIQYTGALVSGKASDDPWDGDRSDIATARVSIDFNAGFQSSLAGLIHLQLKDKLPNEKPPCPDP